MFASLAEPPLQDDRLAYEPKFDGIRALVDVQPGSPPRVRIWSRLGNNKTSQFPEVVSAVQRFARALRQPLLLDGEIVALDAKGNPLGFQHLQERMHLLGAREIAAQVSKNPAALLVFDLLRQGDEDLRPLPLLARRRRLEKVVDRPDGSGLALTPFFERDGRELHQAARQSGLEGLIAKDVRSPYLSGKRTPAWRKLKLIKRQEFVVGGWTEPKGSRHFFGALLLGVYEDGKLRYAGSVGTGFKESELARLAKKLQPLAVEASPFDDRLPPLGEVTWVKPELVAEVTFTEWTAEGYLRHPVYIGLRDDKAPREVRREGPAPPRREGDDPGSKPAPYRFGRWRPKKSAPTAATPSAAKARSKQVAIEVAPPDPEILARLDELEASGKDGFLALPDGSELKVTNLRKVFWPELGITKGELFRHYLRVAPALLPAVEDRPLVMKRYPNGVTRESFYQHRAPEPVPKAIRIIEIPNDDVPSRLVGGDLTTLLYMAQLAVISQDPWFSRIDALDFPDQVAIDLDPMPNVPFTTVLDVARWVHEELRRLGIPGFPKTSGSRGLHIYIPLPPETPYEAGMLLCQIVATHVAARHPRVATVERTVRKRGEKVYVDYLQNIQGKTLATAYSVRANEFAGVSAPLTWEEVHAGVDPRDFTLRSFPERLAAVGDLWAALRASEPVDLHAVAARHG